MTKELKQLEGELIASRPLPKAAVDLLHLSPKDATPMHVLGTVVSMLGTLDPEVGPDNLKVVPIDQREAVRRPGS